MARAVLDPGVLVSALITPTGKPAKLPLSTRAGDDLLELADKIRFPRPAEFVASYVT